jgi:hypothetical protein
MTVLTVGGPIDDVGLCFAVYGADLDPEAVTALLGCTPTSSHRRGDRRGPRSPPAKIGAWFLQVRGRAPRRVEDLIADLLDRLPDDETVMHKLRETYRVQLRIALHLGGFNEGFDLTAKLVEKLAALKVSVGFDIYADPEEPLSDAGSRA